MNKKLIEETLTQIVEMDHQAALKEKELLTIEKDREATLRKVKRELEFEIMKTARKSAKLKVQELTQETECMIDAIERERLTELDNLTKKMASKKPEIVEQLFKEIFEA